MTALAALKPKEQELITRQRDAARELLRASWLESRRVLLRELDAKEPTP